MCGIMGYVGDRTDAKDIILEGLKALEYRGYDSAGIAIIENGNFWSEKRAGKLTELFAAIGTSGPGQGTAIGHTRWATHGPPTDLNAHPHMGPGDRISIVHNGIIENYSELKDELIAEGHQFRSDTDTEVLVHLFEKYYEGDLLTAVKKGLERVTGAYAIAVISLDSPDEIVVAKTASPIVIGVGEDGNYLASGVPALLPYTKQMIYMKDHEYAVITKESVRVFNFDGEEIKYNIEKALWDPITVQKQGYKHFMLKEIFEQPTAVANTLKDQIDPNTGFVKLAGLGMEDDIISKIENITMIACGTAWHSGWTAKYSWQKHLNMPISVELASEFRYSNPYLSQNTLVVAISQSGETADTLAAVQLAKQKGAVILAITNSPGSSLSREADYTFYTQAGPEIGVASTKCFLVQLVALALLELHLGRVRGTLNDAEIKQRSTELLKLPAILENVLNLDGKIRDLAELYYDKSNFLFLGRDILCPMAYEGALKLKEISYIHAEAYAAGELKHGPIALIDEHMPVVVLVTKNSVYEKVFSNVEEVKARKGIVIAFTDQLNADIERISDQIIHVPSTDPTLTPMIFAVPMQLLSYHIGVLRGTDVDQPRNLAKSVTVE